MPKLKTRIGQLFIVPRRRERMIKSVRMIEDAWTNEVYMKFGKRTLVLIVIIVAKKKLHLPPSTVNIVVTDLIV